MTKTESMNGVIKITKRSVRKFQFGDDQPIVEFDIIAVADAWHEVNFAHRELKDDMWVVPPNKANAFGQERLAFVQGLLNDVLGETAPTLTRMEAEEFIDAVVKEANALRNFTSPKGDENLSVPESTAEDRGVNFSQ